MEVWPHDRIQSMQAATRFYIAEGFMTAKAAYGGMQAVRV